LKTTTEEETKRLPVAVMMKLGGSCEKTMVCGEIELRIGTGRALPHKGFSVLHPGRNKSTTSHEQIRTIRQEEGMICRIRKNDWMSHSILPESTVACGRCVESAILPTCGLPSHQE
jgi:hypothetical protein